MLISPRRSMDRTQRCGRCNAGSTPTEGTFDMDNYIKKNVGWILIMVLAIIPVLRWFFVMPLNFRFANIALIATSLGQITGILGMILFALNLIIASKFKFIDRLFFGIPDALNIHSKIGAIGFCLILFHPILLVAKYFYFSIESMAMFFIPQGFDAVSFGIYALVLMILIMVLTLYIKLKYQVWLFSHRFLVLAFVFAVLHSFLIQSDISRDLFLRYYILGFSFFALALSLYNFLSDKIFFKALEYNIIRVQKLAENITQIELEPKYRALKFSPGQFVFVKFISDNLSSESHPFSISSNANNKNIELTIKGLGDFTKKIGNLKIGDKAFVKGPFGKFSFLEFPNKDQVWISGGIGITPFLSMARSLELGKTNQKVNLYYCVKNKSEAILLDELLQIEKNNKHFKVITWFSEEKGQITAEKIVELSNGFANKEIFLCGPVSFMDNLRLQFNKLGVKNINIHWEKFSF